MYPTTRQQHDYVAGMQVDYPMSKTGLEKLMTTDGQRLKRFREAYGFIAALDQSGGSTPGTLRNYGVLDSEYSGEAEMFEQVHLMRLRILTAPAFRGHRVLATILFQATAERDVEDIPLPAWLWHQRDILPILKVDVGLAKESGGVQLMQSIPDLEAVVHTAAQRGVFGTKMRSVIGRYSPGGINEVVGQQFEYANRIIEAGLMPIVEPEVSIGNPDKRKCEDLLHRELLDRLDGLPADRQVALKLTLPEEANLYLDLVEHPNVTRVTALSGGYDQKEACSRLAANNGMIASFSRAFTEGLRRDQSVAEFDSTIARTIESIYSASLT